MATIGIAGATGALGKEILAVLDKAPWRPEKVVALASAKSSIPTVDYGDTHIPVDDLEGSDLEQLDALILAVPPDVAREHGERAVADGVAVVDCSGVFAEDADVPLVVPWVNPEVLRERPLRGIVSIPNGPALLLASVLGPLGRAGLLGPIDATVLVPASAEGRPGIDELSRQVVALFNSGTPPRKVFEQGLAFDLLPSIGAIGTDGWTDREQRAVAEVIRIVGPMDITVTLIGVPLFSGISANISIGGVTADAERLADILSEGGVQVPKATARQIPRPRRVDGHPFAHVGRIRTDAHGVHLWAVLDNLRGAAAVAVGACGVLIRSGRKN